METRALERCWYSDATGVGTWTTLSSSSSAPDGWHGDTTRIKIHPGDFLADDDDNNQSVVIEDDGGNWGVRVQQSSLELFCMVPIPVGFEATDVRLYGNNTRSVTVYEMNYTTGGRTTLGSGSVGSNINITDTPYSSTNYILIRINTSSTSDVIYGGHVLISRP